MGIGAEMPDTQVIYYNTTEQVLLGAHTTRLSNQLLLGESVKALQSYIWAEPWSTSGVNKIDKEDRLSSQK